MIRILLADDEPIALAMLKRGLEQALPDAAGFIETAVDGLSAVECALRFRPNIAVLDIEMPGLNGLEAGQILKAQLPGCRVIYLTAYNKFEYAVEALRHGADDYLLKPVRMPELIEKIGQAAAENAVGRDGSTASQSGATAGAAAGRSGETDVRTAAARQGATSGPAFAETAASGPPGAALADGLPAQEFRLSVTAYIKKHYHRDLSLADLAAFLHQHPNYVSRRFRQTFGCTFSEYLLSERMRLAQSLLRETDLSIRQIAERTGYTDPDYFAKLFRRSVGSTPSVFRRSSPDKFL